MDKECFLSEPGDNEDTSQNDNREKPPWKELCRVLAPCELHKRLGFSEYWVKLVRKNTERNRKFF